MTKRRKKPEELIIPLPNGYTLRCGEGDEYQWGGYVRICDKRGREMLYWSHEDWKEDSECVMGAIFAAALTDPCRMMNFKHAG